MSRPHVPLRHREDDDDEFGHALSVTLLSHKRLPATKPLAAAEQNTVSLVEH